MYTNAVVDHAHRKPFLIALAINFLWINASEICRYFFWVKPMLMEAFPDRATEAVITPGILVAWLIWDAILILAATGYYWMYLQRFPNTAFRAVLSATTFIFVAFGILSLGVVNMGLATLSVMLTALPLAWLEQLVAALLTGWVIRRFVSATT